MRRRIRFRIRRIRDFRNFVLPENKLKNKEGKEGFFLCQSVKSFLGKFLFGYQVRKIIRFFFVFFVLETKEVKYE
uniref:Uncharacterized protein n=1 Tax=Cucumis sativus TaxID=3659 RepID=A0A0A0K621_CUCSA